MAAASTVAHGSSAYASSEAGSEAGGRGSRSDWFAHTLGWWRLACMHPEAVLWVRYEEMLKEPLEQVRAVAHFLQSPAAADEARLRNIVEASSFGEMKSRHEADRANVEARNDGETGHFRRGESGDWRRHLSVSQARRFSELMEERLAGSGLERAFSDGG